MKTTTIETLNQLKKCNTKFAIITVYDASFASLFSEQGINVMLVGDSVGMTVQGEKTTLSVTVEQMVYHTRCVRKGAPNAFIITDMPFMTYATPEQACINAAKFIQAGANMIKLEGGHWLCDTIEMLQQRSVPVCGHIGLTPQAVNILGGYKVQGRNDKDANQLIEDAILLEKAGMQLLVLECVPAALAAKITKELIIPVIGIGAGNQTDGQVIVMHDILGITRNAPQFTKNFLAETGGDIRDAIRLYIKQVEDKTYPDVLHSFE
ncbi:3-methyl-2-oxobutanoate hydroxymethyltransferase [Liberibacter crescens BT-1]|uniref:3-methyl-2-oxobutanoate hydroxymethyltransferase n=1 Tax=Liberibacter crescens (strain BT-1) TaxID=1215343 RepID=L0EU60_LIBCB|nr:3-methyl-2-oxobutanoate hydroxymethyltransferase [Liberibacter crescens]AGA64390.1 3-methyl-2-oxobutanoate hydroxymethyltransferase [Liberibacter crescens BT-1]AMC12575.1 3-methyl-2-oxobutanoate hydroxymethyltransferase [Liberibacter crescens]